MSPYCRIGCLHLYWASKIQDEIREFLFIGGIRGTDELERLVDSGDYAVAMAMFATPAAALLNVADSGNVMPPKSTWFEPKLRSGLFVHLID